MLARHALRVRPGERAAKEFLSKSVTARARYRDALRFHIAEMVHRNTVMGILPARNLYVDAGRTAIGKIECKLHTLGRAGALDEEAQEHEIRVQLEGIAAADNREWRLMT